MLKNGHGICTVCSHIGPQGYNVISGGERFPTCELGCEYDNGKSVRIVMQDDIEEGFPNHSAADAKFVADLVAANKNHPSITSEFAEMFFDIQREMSAFRQSGR